MLHSQLFFRIIIRFCYILYMLQQSKRLSLSVCFTYILFHQFDRFIITFLIGIKQRQIFIKQLKRRVNSDAVFKDFYCFRTFPNRILATLTR